VSAEAGGRRPAATKRYPPPEGIRLVFIALMVMWVAFPVLIRDNLAQDALPYVVAGDLVDTDPGVVYAAEGGDLFTLDPVFAAASCAAAPPGTDCSNLSVAFVSTPLAVPFAIVMSWLGPTGGVLVMRLLAALSLVGGMWVLWNRLADRTPHAARSLVLTALALTPFATVPIAMGQTSPVLFVSAAVAVSRTDRVLRLVAVAGLWVAAIVLKAFPAVLGLVLIWQRRWRLIGAAAAWFGGLAVLTLVSAPASLWGDFFRTSGELSVNTAANPYNGSVDALFTNLLSVTDLGAASVPLTLVRFALVVGLGWWAATHLDDDSQWAYAYLLVMLVVPLVWWHYLWVAVAAIGLVLAGRARLDDRMLLVLPVLAAVTIPISIPNSRGWSIPVAQGIFLLATVALVPLLSERRRVPSAWRRASVPDADGSGSAVAPG
jgi:hypothetical protein